PYTDPAPTELSPLSLHDALPIYRVARSSPALRADFDRHEAVTLALDRHHRQPAAVGLPRSLHVLQGVIDQRRPVQPLAEQPLQVLPRDLLGHFPERLLVHVLELPAGVIGPQDAAHRF